MENSVWRSRAKIVAIVDLIFSSFGLLITIVLVLVAGAVTESVVADKNDFPDMENITDDQTKGSLINIWIVTGVAALLTAIQLWAAIKLLNATEMGRNAHEALQMAKVWRFVTIAFLILEIFLRVFVLSGYKTAAVELVIRGLFLFVVHRFMEDLEGITQVQQNSISVNKI